jgi:P-type Ca2+ transporter type 2C
MKEDIREMPEANKEKTVKWHSIEVDAALEKLKTSPEDGLDEAEVGKRLEEYGENRLPEPKKQSSLVRFLLHFHNILIYVLIAAAGITALMDHWVDTFVILAVVIVNAVIGYLQEGKAERALEAIRKMLSLEASVIRGGKRTQIDAAELVPGDVVLLRSGDKVPADIRVIESKNFRIEESPLTGESTDVGKTTDPAEENAVLGDRKSMAYSGTMVTFGSATGVVVTTGANTEIGKITEMIAGVEKITTPLLQKIDRFGLKLSLFILVFSGIFFAFGYFFREYTIVELFLATISVIVASIPEGLPAIMTITLAIGVQRMARRNAIIRRLPSVETLGSVSVICSDKTGTLTRNEMTAKTILTAEDEYEVDGTGYNPEGKIKKDGAEVDIGSEPVLEKLMQSIRACNDASLEKDEGGEWKLQGTPTEGSLMTLAYKAGLKDFKPKRIDTIPFESEHKYMATLNEIDGKRFVFLKGAPEKLLEACSKQATADGPKDIDLEYWEEWMESVAERGQRLIAAAYREEKGKTESIDHEDVGENMVFLGLIGIIDPPRDEVHAAIEECKAAGIRVIMITGDHAITARAIAKDLGIDDGTHVITGSELEEMDDERLAEVAMETNVFARTSPEHKLRLVKALQSRNKLCAMTGDGVNDAPALKQANIGVAMGIKGTEVSKDAAEMVLADDNFTSIVNAVEEGRTVYDNIRKTILFLLPTNGAEALVLIAAILMGITMPITPAQILWVNMVTAVTLALALAFEPMERRVMELPPRDPDEPILGKYFLWRIFYVSVLIGGLTLLLYRMMRNNGIELDTARTIAVNTLVAGQAFYLFNCRKFHETVFTRVFFNNMYVFIAIGALIIFQMIFTYVPFMNTMFGTSPIEWIYWVYVAASGLAVLIIVEAEKFMARRLAQD